MSTKITFLFLLGVLQVPTIFADGKSVIKEYEPIITDYHVRLEVYKAHINNIEIKIISNLTDIIEETEKKGETWRQQVQAYVNGEINKATCTADDDKKLECLYTGNMEFNNTLLLPSQTALRTCVGIFSSTTTTSLEDVQVFINTINSITNDILGVNELCTANGTSDVMRLCFFKELVYNRLPKIDALEPEEQDVWKKINAVVEVSKTKLTKCFDLFTEGDYSTANKIIKNFEKCCN